MLFFRISLIVLIYPFLLASCTPDYSNTGKNKTGKGNPSSGYLTGLEAEHRRLSQLQWDSIEAVNSRLKPGVIHEWDEIPYEDSLKALLQNSKLNPQIMNELILKSDTDSIKRKPFFIYLYSDGCDASGVMDESFKEIVRDYSNELNFVKIHSGMQGLSAIIYREKLDTVDGTVVTKPISYIHKVSDFPVFLGFPSYLITDSEGRILNGDLVYRIRQGVSPDSGTGAQSPEGAVPVLTDQEALEINYNYLENKIRKGLKLLNQ